MVSTRMRTLKIARQQKRFVEIALSSGIDTELISSLGKRYTVHAGTGGAVERTTRISYAINVQLLQ